MVLQTRLHFSATRHSSRKFKNHLFPRKAQLVKLLRIDAARISRIVAPEPTVCLVKLGEI